MTQEIKYAPVDSHLSDDGEDVQILPKRQVQRKWAVILSSFILGVMSAGALLACYSSLRKPLPHARNIPHAVTGLDPVTGIPLAWSNGDCGNSPEEALARLCQYNIVLHAWLPPSCLNEADAEDTKYMYHDQHWHYETAEGKNLTIDELGAGDYGHFITTYDWHIMHCMYVWKRLHRALLDPSIELDTYTASYDHTSHCVGLMNENLKGPKESRAIIFVKYPKCGK